MQVNNCWCVSFPFLLPVYFLFGFVRLIWLPDCINLCELSILVAFGLFDWQYLLDPGKNSLGGSMRFIHVNVFPSLLDGQIKSRICWIRMLVHSWNRIRGFHLSLFGNWQSGWIPCDDVFQLVCIYPTNGNCFDTFPWILSSSVFQLLKWLNKVV